jgi:segregation and condensation protein A
MTALQRVTVSGFEGPLDLLLELIEQEKLDVSRMSLAQVTDQYLMQVRSLTLPPEDLAQFLVVASRLVLLKSKRLLPHLQLAPDEEEGIVSLEEQLREYQRFRAVARVLRERWLSSGRQFARAAFLGVAPAFFPPLGIDGAALLAAISTVVKGLPVTEMTREEAIRKVLSLEERIRTIQERLKGEAEASFQETLTKGAPKEDVIVSFLALLELVKQRIVEAEQSHAFRDILIRKRQPHE